MLALLSYLHTCFIRSYKYGPATVIFLGGIVLIYSVVPNPIMESYAFSTSFLFVMTSMLCYSFIDLEKPNQEVITVMHSNSLVMLYCAKLLYCWLFTVPLAMFAILYPFLFGMFDRQPTIEQLLISFTYHILTSWLSIVSTVWFSLKFIRSRLMSFLLLSLLVIITLTAQGISEQIPQGLSFMPYILPPLRHIINVYMQFESVGWNDIVLVMGATFLYSCIITLLFLYVINRRKLDRTS